MSGLLSTAEEVINQARDGEQLEAYVSRGSSTEVKVYGGEVESFTSATSAGIGIRVIRDGRVGFAHAGTLEPDVVSETLAEARDNLAFSEPDEWVEMAEPDDGTPIVHDHWADSVAETETETKIQMAMELAVRDTTFSVNAPKKMRDIIFQARSPWQPPVRTQEALNSLSPISRILSSMASTRPLDA